ncbi:response regulator [Halomicroarcula sp. GCM10025709]|uniref:response regulator n=1 Tax=Haloarcula TaxID=2237 RepID=UPI0024C42A96|nr:response regulator [Halomicroarcula sp. YJ-61-S]
MSDTVGRVMVADDDPDLRECYRLWLGESYDVVAVADGDAVLERLDDTVDVLLLDREMPETSGKTVAAELAAGPYDPGVLMISGVEPTVDLLDIPVDEYLTKPVGRDAVLRSIERVGVVAQAPSEVRELFALASRAGTLDATVEQGRLDECEEYARLLSRLRAQRSAIDDALDRTTSTEGWRTAVEAALERSDVDVAVPSVGARQ